MAGLNNNVDDMEDTGDDSQPNITTESADEQPDYSTRDCGEGSENPDSSTSCSLSEDVTDDSSPPTDISPREESGSGGHLETAQGDEDAPPPLDPVDSSGQARDQLYEKATELAKKGKLELALNAYLSCLKGLQKNAGFTYLPQCLHSVADIYFKKGEFDKAIQFIQAEKMYYETALMDVTQLQKKFEEKLSGGDAPSDQGMDNNEIQRAEQYEHLARLCLSKQQAQLALEYQGKATKLRQQVYGDEHGKTVESLDLFTAIYAEVGKHQYSESLHQFTAPLLPETIGSMDEKDISDDEATKEDSASTVLRNRKEVRSKGPRDDPTEENSSPGAPEKQPYLQPEQEEWVSSALLWILMFIVTVSLSVMVAFLYCRASNSDLCVYYKSEAQFYYRRFKYYFYHYTKIGSKQYG